MRGAREGVQLGGLGEEAHLVIVFVGAWRPGKGRLVGRAAQQAHWELWGHIPKGGGTHGSPCSSSI